MSEPIERRYRHDDDAIGRKQPCSVSHEVKQVKDKCQNVVRQDHFKAAASVLTEIGIDGVQPFALGILGQGPIGLEALRRPATASCHLQREAHAGAYVQETTCADETLEMREHALVTAENGSRMGQVVTGQIGIVIVHRSACREIGIAGRAMEDRHDNGMAPRAQVENRKRDTCADTALHLAWAATTC